MAASVLALAMTAGCTLGPDVPSRADTASPSTGAVGTPSPSAIVAPEPAVTVVVGPREAMDGGPGDGPGGPGGIEATPAAGSEIVDRPDPDSLQVLTRTATGPDGSVAAVYRVIAPAGATGRSFPDGTAAVLDATGGLLLGFAPPEVRDADERVLGGRWEVDPATSPEGTAAPGGGGAMAFDVRLTRAAARGVDATPGQPVTVQAALGRTFVSAVDWGDREGGRSLALFPTRWGRASGLLLTFYGFADVVRLEPSADLPGMLSQYRCHVLGARSKETWNLEPWRPEVNDLAMIAAQCNPVE